MVPSHKAVLLLGSNVDPEDNLVKAIRLLHGLGEIQKISSVWESQAVGAVAPNYLNASLVFLSTNDLAQLKEFVINPIEQVLGRSRSTDKYSPRTMDIDVILFDNKPIKMDYWQSAFMLIPFSQVAPEYVNPITSVSVLLDAHRLKAQSWIRERPGVLDPVNDLDLQRPGSP